MYYFGWENLDKTKYQLTSNNRLRSNYIKEYSKCQKIKCSLSEICVMSILTYHFSIIQMIN